MSNIPTKDENPDGLHQHYEVKPLKGERDPNANYFVLRIDAGGDDLEHLRACMAAARIYAHQIRDHIPGLSRDLHRLLDMEEVALTNRMATNGTGREITEDNILRLGDGGNPKLTIQEKADLSKEMHEKTKKFAKEVDPFIEEDVRTELDNIITSMAFASPEMGGMHRKRVEDLIEENYESNENLARIADKIFNPPKESDV